MMPEGGAPRIVVDERPDPALHEAIGDLLDSFNDSKIGPVTAEQLAIVVRDPDTDALIGGLWGRSAVGWMYVELLVVAENLRRRGIGTRLVRTAEDIARRRGCIGCWLHTG